MPAGDGTGPMGMGPMTGRGAGYCGGYGMPGYANPGPGRGLGVGWGWGGGWGRGRGWRHWYHATGLPGWARFGYAPAWGAPTAWGAPPPAYGPYAAPPAPEQEIEFLKAQAGWLQQQLDGISQRITELEQET
jgi:hypothetical protein